ncbi:SAM-dependent methyltransferase [Lactobacillus sp. ESL0703]|uniref:SAM-dependent methyltransferase n=1 Tax=Lactobacillus sp. ESL0703 TaxID=2983218 RepID=UPI0023F9A8DD|nr:SAM-dependent methyltransferase [Lactobacillus sp. ESL0703]MDF7668307.1 SAM-dependent methyltransferase [Lactobacillus sp. ESL0703]
MTNFLDKINQLNRQIKHPTVNQQVAEINQIINKLDQHQVLETAPAKLGLLPDEVEAVLQQVGDKQDANLKVLNQLLNSLRQFLSIRYGLWSLPNLTTARLIKEQLHVTTALEIMAGNAYWSKALAEVQIKTIATDSLEWSKTSATGSQPAFDVVDLDAAQAIKQFANVDLVICSWAPNFTESDLLAVAAWKKYNPKSHLLFVGEKNGATNSPAFWQTMKLHHSPQLRKINQSFQSYDFINEQIFEIEHEI